MDPEPGGWTPNPTSTFRGASRGCPRDGSYRDDTSTHMDRPPGSGSPWACYGPDQSCWAKGFIGSPGQNGWRRGGGTPAEPPAPGRPSRPAGVRTGWPARSPWAPGERAMLDRGPTRLNRPFLDATVETRGDHASLPNSTTTGLLTWPVRRSRSVSRSTAGVGCRSRESASAEDGHQIIRSDRRARCGRRRRNGTLSRPDSMPCRHRRRGEPGSARRPAPPLHDPTEELPVRYVPDRALHLRPVTCRPPGELPIC